MVGACCSMLRGHADLNLIQMVELKNGESFNGHLIDCDTFMNITLREVYQTSAESDRFWKLKEVYIRGSTVCLLSILVIGIDQNSS
jgi:U6 snRNA-associated Sm-like protein LSm4